MIRFLGLEDKPRFRRQPQPRSPPGLPLARELALPLLRHPEIWGKSPEPVMSSVSDTWAGAGSWPGMETVRPGDAWPGGSDPVAVAISGGAIVAPSTPTGMIGQS